MAFKTFRAKMANKGLVAKYALDDCPPDTYIQVQNAESRQENSFSSRFGRESITNNGAGNTPLDQTTILTLGRLLSLRSFNPNTFRYAIGGSAIYRRATDTDGAYTRISGAAAVSGQRASMNSYRPAFSSVPYQLIADAGPGQLDPVLGTGMFKDRGDGSLATVQNWGIMPPDRPAICEDLGPGVNYIQAFEAITGLTFAVWGVNPAPTAVVATTFANNISAGMQSVTPAAMTNIAVGRVLTCTGGLPAETVVVLAVTATTFTAYFENSHVIGDNITDGSLSGTTPGGASTCTVTSSVFAPAHNLDLVQVAYQGGIQSSLVASGDFLIGFWVKLSDFTKVTSINLLIDVADGTFTVGWYSAAFTPTANGWTFFSLAKSQFTINGDAGQPLSSWSNFKAWQIQVVSTDTSTVAFDDLYLFGGPQSSTGGTVGYDYRYTYFNINTGGESTPSVTMFGRVQVNNQVIHVQAKQGVGAVPTLDPQITHVRLYRRGGTLPSEWLLVLQQPVTGAATLEMYDSVTDSVLQNNAVLDLAKDPPVTSNLKVPVNTTVAGSNIVAGPGVGDQSVQVASTTNMSIGMYLLVDTGANQETVVVQNIADATHFQAYFQLTHPTSTVIFGSAKTARPLNLMAIAFDRAWLAGDPDNPHVLYYSDRFEVESFPPQNYVEVGSPKDPIMAVVELNGQLFVFTRETVYQVFVVGSNPPVPYKTAARHGLWANFGWCIVEGQIWYVSEDGIYAFTGGASTYMSQDVEWVFRGLNLGPTIAIDMTTISDVILAYNQHEVFVSYQGTDGGRYRLIYWTTYKRWRFDTVPASAMLFEPDTADLVIATYLTVPAGVAGNIYIDRNILNPNTPAAQNPGTYDEGPWTGGKPTIIPMPFAIQTPYSDQGLPDDQKVYQMLVLDIDTQGETYNVTMRFNVDSLAPIVIPIGTVTTQARDRVAFAILDGLGQKAQNASVSVTGTIDHTSTITWYEYDYEFTISGKLRKTYDTYWTDMGLDGFKFAKQMWIQYQAPDADVTVDVYLDGNDVTPAYSFTLPQTAARLESLIKLPPDVDYGGPPKATLWRMVAHSTADWTLYFAEVDMKQVNTMKGYQKIPVPKVAE